MADIQPELPRCSAIEFGASREALFCDVRQGEHGFTLVELLVSLALLALMSIYAVSALGTFHTLSSVETRVSRQMEVAAVARHMRQTIADMRASFFRSPNGQTQVLFSGTPSSLEFQTVLSPDLQYGGLHVLRYLRADDGTFTLQEPRAFLNPEAGTRVTLLQKTASLTYYYLGTDIPGEAPAWHDQWTPSDRLPLAIRVNITFPDSDSRSWRTLTIPVVAAR